MTNEMQREIKEAITAGERALGSLYDAKRKLNSARSWGIFDLLGGGGLVSLVKHSRLNDASSYLQQAGEDLKLFQRELHDVDVPGTVHVQVDGFLTFADFFFDGLIADYLVQTKINGAIEKVQDTIDQVERILAELRRCQ